MELQRQVGNTAVVALLKDAQAKLEVGAADDPFEREADMIAERVVREIAAPIPPADPASKDSMLTRSVRRSPALRVRRVADPRPATVGAQGGAIDAGTEALLASARSGGRPLDGAVRRTMERAFGADFDAVRIHTGARAGELNRRIEAKAFTVGSDIFFKGGAPDITNRQGATLLAHELAHTVQQGAAPVDQALAPRTARRTIQRDFDTAAAELDALLPPTVKAPTLRNWFSKKAAAAGIDAEAFWGKHGLEKDAYAGVSAAVNSRRAEKAAADEEARLTAGMTLLADFKGVTTRDHNKNIFGTLEAPDGALTEVGVQDGGGAYTLGGASYRMFGCPKGSLRFSRVYCTSVTLSTKTSVVVNVVNHGTTFPDRTINLQPTFTRIAAGTKLAHPNDGSVWFNVEGRLTARPTGYYREYVIPASAATPAMAGVGSPGPMRLVKGLLGDLHVTGDHYGSFTTLT